MAVAAAPGASASVVDSGTENIEFENDVIEDFCDVEDLTVLATGTFSVRYRVVTRGADQIPYFMGTSSFSQTLTNEDTGLSVRETSRVLDKDLSIELEEGGTYLVTVLATGAANVWGPDGKLIAANPGQIRYQLRLDESFEVIEEIEPLVKESTGRNDDFCEAVVPAIT